ncbi:MAG: SRPBCC family protein [Anaerolineae bacterium]|nr:SRPBCC family protein [Anaerolineae bacterium]
MTISVPTDKPNAYHFITNWRVYGAMKDVIDIIGDAADLPRWWPAVYLEVKVLEPGDERGVGRVVDLYTKGWLPYTLRWQFKVSDTSETSFRIQAMGDFAGYGIWTFEPDGEWTKIKYEWKIEADKPLLRDFSIIAKPAFALNHEWAMRKGEESLQLELARRRAQSEQERALIPAPPPPTTDSPIPLLVGSLAALFISWRLLRGLFRVITRS